MARPNTTFRLLLLSLLTLLPSLTTAQQQLSPALPLKASSRWILDANNNRVKLRCVNWAGHQEANIPEGLDKQSVEYLVDWIKKQGFNCVRLTYSTDHALDPNLSVSDSFNRAASAAGVSPEAMRKLYDNVVLKNPSFGGNTTTREVFGYVVDTLWERAGIFTILDNHVSKASWCCNLTDGNGWWDEAFGYNSWNSRFFKTQEWLNGLKAMAIWARGHPGVVAMSLRNEIRAFLLQDLNGRADWYKYIKMAGDLVHANNKDVLIVVGGVQSSTDLIHLRDGKMLDISGWGRDKHVWEMHAYSFTVNFPDPFQNCDLVKAQYGLYSGFVLEQGRSYTGPMILSEFGVGMTGGNGENGLDEKNARYLNCLVDYMTGNDADWAIWAIQGTYYVRDGVVDYNEDWGLMDKEWKDWRNKAFPGMLKGMWKVTQGPSMKKRWSWLLGA